MSKLPFKWFVRFYFFGARWPIYRQILQYSDWRALKYPDAAHLHEKELLRFVFRTRIRDVRNILVEDITGYQDTITSDYYRGAALKSLRQFFKFCKEMGYANIQIEVKNGILRMEKIHHLLDIDNVIRVKKLRARKIDGKPMSYRKIKAYMEKKDSRTYDVHAIYRWANYKLPAEFELA